MAIRWLRCGLPVGVLDIAPIADLGKDDTAHEALTTITIDIKLVRERDAQPLFPSVAREGGFGVSPQFAGTLIAARW